MPDWKHEIRRRLAGVKLEPTREAAIVEELAQLLDDCYEESLSGGATPAEAYSDALAELSGGELLTRELQRIERRIKREPVVLGTNRRANMLAAFWQDLRYGARMLFKNPGFTLIAVITLSLGIGANSAIFSVVNSVLLREAPYREPRRLVMVWSDRPQFQARTGMTEFPVSAADFTDWRDQNQGFEQIAAFHSQALNLTGFGEPEVLGAVRASVNLFALLGVEPRRGRVFLPEEDQAGANRVVILSDGLWQRRFGSDPKVIGQTISLNNEPYTVVGVMPPDFQFPRKADLPAGFGFPSEVHLYAPLALTPEQRNNRGRHYLAVIARLKPQTSFDQAQAEMVGIAGRLERQYPDLNRNKSVRLVGFHQQVVGKARFGLLTLLGAVGFVLLIACANVANLLLARGAARQKEIAIRTALGAGRWRVIRQLLTESLLLAASAGALAMLLAVWGVDLLRMILPDNLPRADEIGVDFRVFGFTLVITLLTGILFGLIPALQASRTDINETLKEGGRSSGGSGHNRFRGLLVVSEVALALVLLVGAGLMMRSFVLLMSVDPGLDPQNVLTMDIRLLRGKYQPSQQVAFFRQLLERLRALPGVHSAGAVYPLPLSGMEEGTGFGIEGQPPPAPGERRNAGPRWVSPDYFKTLKIQLLKGRVFTEGDGGDSPPVLIINEAMARQYWPNEDPVGRRVSFNSRDNQPVWREIVGVVKDVRHTALDTESKPQMYFPFTQFPSSFMTLVARTDGDPLSFVAAMRGQVQAIDRDQPVSNIHTMEELLARSVSQRRFNLLLLAFFAGVALLLAAVGIYGVMSYSVEQRTHEIGVRMALGARTADVMRLLIGHGMKLVATGVAIGLAGAFALTRLISTLLFGVRANDPLTFAVIALSLALVSLAACWIPARRATKVDPLVALRRE
jgi:putative ABC transport system permease protein